MKRTLPTVIAIAVLGASGCGAPAVVNDAGLDSGLADAGFEGGLDSGVDGGSDAGVDGGNDAGPDGGYDGGLPG